MLHSGANNVLLTGRPGCGKTTVVRRAVQAMPNLRLAGFYTQEIRGRDRRVGFEAIGLAGGSAVLAHVDFRSNRRVGRYGVLLDGFEALLHAELDKPVEDVDLFIIDEFGKMECFSDAFIESATRVLNSAAPVLATIAARSSGLISQVKARSDVQLLTVSAANRDHLAAQLADRFRPD